MYPPPPSSSTTSSSSNAAQQQKPGGLQGGLTRYCSAPGSFLTKAVDSVIGSAEEGRQFYAANTGNHNKYFSGGGESFSSSQLTSESGCRVNSSSVEHKSGGGGEQLKRSDALNAIARGASPSSSSLLRQRSSPAGFLSNLVSESGFSITRGGSGGYDSHNNNAGAANGGGGGYQPVQRLKSQLSFTGPESALSHISEASESDVDVDVETGRGRHHSSYNNPASSGFVMDWDNSPNSITFSSGQPSKKFRAVDGDIYTCYNGLDTQFSMPQTTLEMATVDKLMHIPEDSVPCRVRAKRGFATHPRSIAERERRTRISGRLKKLQDLVPNMDKQTSYSDMLDLAVQHIKGLQNELEKLHEDMENCTCGCRPSK
ncbi:unnamed protein product [Linum trigynum]|uniref:BHLH domain-containing protein n=1 Tax=Linum trigynum TaxID=586398 RepID=A0AAV2D2Y8_9ROSI